MGEPETSQVDGKNINIAMDLDEHRYLLMQKVEFGIPHWKDFVVAGGEALRREYARGNLREVAKAGYEKMGKMDDAERVHKGMRTSSFPNKTAKRA